MVSNTVYVQLAVCEKLARDLDLDVDELIAALPRAKNASKHLWDPADTTTPRNQYGPRGKLQYGMSNTDQEVH